METQLEVWSGRLLKLWQEWAPAMGVVIAILVCLVWTVYLPIVGLRHLLGY
ncbi:MULTISPECIES: hypothetical protein [unclassified Mesorhizobium]|uniref:hypothetical protein n=1 Tax=unclassified Mesorhizobium TaxID=325217 RepID=UPI0015E44CCA|nr:MULTISPECIES: hypothetical protein [unclassified Mesorhizobium]MBZ9704596.1 hypothetical protein [Mesorhizobium sp. CO1-1-3]MBZ9950356.1 hypothetical protein [Mesorhizobium sp. BR1-1-11]